MGISWLLFLIITAAFTYRGYRQGVWTTLTKVLSLVIAYVVAIVFSSRFSSFIEQNTVVEGMAALVTAGVILFFITFFLSSFILTMLCRLFQGEKPSGLSAGIGAMLGVVIGSVFGLVAVYMVSYLMAVLPKQTVQASAKEPTAIEKVANQAAGKVVSWVGGLSGIDSSTAKLGQALAREPGEVLQHVRNLQNNQAVKSLFTDGQNQAVLKSGNVEAIQSLPAFQALVETRDMQELVALSGLDEDGNANQVIAENMSSIWQRADRLKNDNEIQALLNDPQLREQLESGNPLSLMNNAKFHEVAKLLLGPTEEKSRENSQSMSGDTEIQLNKPETEIHQWTDEDGNVHYSDRNPNSQ